MVEALNDDAPKYLMNHNLNSLNNTNALSQNGDLDQDFFVDTVGNLILTMQYHHIGLINLKFFHETKYPHCYNLIINDDNSYSLQYASVHPVHVPYYKRMIFDRYNLDNHISLEVKGYRLAQ